MSELAKTHIDITDESSYGAGASPIIPLYVFATMQDKVINDETGEIAVGTSKEVAKQLLLMTSRKDVTDTFGVPSFTETDGTIQQGDELNEVGLYALYDALGSVSLAYALRADIDLKQLQSSKSEPTSFVDNNTLWFDTSSTIYGVFRANGNIRPALAWDNVSDILVPSESELDESGKPLSTYGNDGNIAVVSKNNKQIMYENIAQEWVELGSDEWIAKYPSYAKGISSGTYTAGAKILVQGVEVTLNGDTPESKIADAVNDINTALEDAGVTSVVALEENGALLIKNNETLLTLSEADDLLALSQLGFNVTNKNAKVVTVSLVHKTHSQVPSGLVQGSIWIKTTEPNFGAKYVMKKFNSTSKSWSSSVMPMYGSYLEAEKDLGKLGLSADKIIVKYDYDNKSETRLSQFGSQSMNVVQSTISNPTLTSGNSFSISTIVNNDIKTYNIRLSGTAVNNLSKNIANARIPNIISDVTSDGYLRIISTTGNTIKLQSLSGTILSDLGFTDGEYTKWIEPTYIAKSTEPTNPAINGTLWFNGDDYLVDIMVNDGQSWRGYKNVYDCAEIFITSSQPEKHSDESELVDYDLWVNTASNEYPEIYRYMNGNWELIDNTDQTTPLGIVFADARENAGPSYSWDEDGIKNSTHTPFSTKLEDMMLSDYVDPNCPNPLSYPSDILLFNTLYSTNNVKEMVDEYKDSLKELGETFTVGNSKEFSTPGSKLNPKTSRWETASGNDNNGTVLCGRKAQRKMIVNALAEAINSNDDIRSDEYDFFFANCAGYPELDDELTSLNVDKKEMFYIVTDTPKYLQPKADNIINWASNKNNAVSHGEDGRVTRNAYMTRQYPSMGLTTNVDGNEIAVPSSVAKMKNLLTLPRGMFAAGTQYGQVKNLSSVGYITDENEYSSVVVKDGLGEVIVQQSMNPIMPRRNTGLLFWGENTENNYTSSLSDEHAILTLLRLKRELDEACLPFFFQPHTESLRADFDAALRSILNDYVSRDELYDYVLVTDRSVNTNERIERKELWAEIAIEIVKGVEQIYIPIRIVKTGSLSS